MQALYHTAFLRDAVFQIPSGTVKAAEVESDSDDEAVGTVGPQRTKKRSKWQLQLLNPRHQFRIPLLFWRFNASFTDCSSLRAQLEPRLPPRRPFTPAQPLLPACVAGANPQFRLGCEGVFTPHDVRLVRQARDKNEEDRRRECPETALLRKDVGKMLLQWHLRSTSVLKRIEPGAIQRLGAVYEAIYIWRLYMLD